MPEPPPQQGKEEVYPAFLDELAEVLALAKERGGAAATSKSATYPALLHLAEERVEAGRLKYGTMLMTGNGRNALRDAWEECFDQCKYLKQALMEGYPEVAYLLKRSLWSLFDLTRLLMWQDPELAKRCGYVHPKRGKAARVEFPDYLKGMGS
jgi:hypothetical protein